MKKKLILLFITLVSSHLVFSRGPARGPAIQTGITIDTTGQGATSLETAKGYKFESPGLVKRQRVPASTEKISTKGIPTKTLNDINNNEKPVSPLFFIPLLFALPALVWFSMMNNVKTPSENVYSLEDFRKEKDDDQNQDSDISRAS